MPEHPGQAVSSRIPAGPHHRLDPRCCPGQRAKGMPWLRSADEVQHDCITYEAATAGVERVAKGGSGSAFPPEENLLDVPPVTELMPPRDDGVEHVLIDER